MRARTAILTGFALSVLGCVSDPMSVSEEPSLAGATTREYTHVHLSRLGDWPASVAYGINAAGQIVGTSAGHATLWDKGVLKDLGDWGNEYSTGTVATAINNRGQLVGYSYEDYGEGEVQEAFLWYKGTLTNIGFGVPSDINERGQVVGSGPGWLWESGVLTYLDIDAHAINNAGQIAGQIGGQNYLGSAAIWDKGSVIDLGTLGHEPSGYYFSGAFDINDRGQVVGFSTVQGGNGPHAFLWEKGVMTDLGTLGGDWSEARAINNAGQIVGYSATSEGAHAFLWEKGVMRDLGTLGGPIAKAFGINEKGVIVGATGIYEEAPDQPTMWTRKGKVK